MIVMFLILFLAISTHSFVLHYNLSNNDYSIKILIIMHEVHYVLEIYWRRDRAP